MRAMPSTSIEWVRWGRDVMPRLVSQRAISRGEGLMLKELCSRSDRCGGCFASARTLGEGIGVGERQAERLLDGLRSKRLVSSARRGRGCIRTLQPDAVPDLLTGQLSFDDLLDGLIPEPVQQALPAEPQPASVPAAPPTSSSGLPTSGCREKEEKFAGGGDARSASTPDRTSEVLEEHLVEVLAILEAAPGLFVEPLAVNSALAAHPERVGYDHLAAAHVVASYAHEGGLHITAANRLLLAVLRKQPRPAKPGAAPGARWHGGRRRTAPPVTPEVAQEFERQTETVERLMAAAGFGRPR
jgi:hypothetical protein